MTDIAIRVGLDGDDEVRAKLDAMATDGEASMGRIADAGDKATAKLQSSLSRLTFQIDPMARLAAGQNTLNAAQAAGLISTDRQSSLLALLTQKYGDVEAAGGRSAVASGRLLTQTRAAFAELSSGNVGRGVATLGLIGTRLAGLTLGTVAWVAALAGVPIALAVAADQSEQALQRIQDSLSATGHAGGVTAGQIMGSADQVSANSSLSTSSARETVATLASSGRIAPDLLGPSAALTPYVARATGSSQQDATKLLQQILEDPAKGAEEVAQRFNALDAAQLRQVDQLVASGQAQDAQRIIVEALTARLKAMGPAQESWWAQFSNGLSDFWTRLGDSQRGPRTTEEQLVTDTGANPGIAAGGMLGPGDFGSSAAMDEVYQNAADVAQRQQDAERESATRAQQLAQQNQLIEQATQMAASYDTVDEKNQKLTDSAKLFTSAAAAAQEQYDALNQAVMTGTTEDPDAAIKLKNLADILNLLKTAATGAAAAAGHQLDPAAERLQTLQDQARQLSAAPRDRQRIGRQNEIQAQYRQNQANPQTAATADQDRTQGLANLNLEEGNKDSDTDNKLNQEAAGLERVAAAYRDSVAAGDQQKILEEAHAAFLAGAVNNEAKYAAALTNVADAQRDAKSAETDSNLQGELAEKQLELSLMGKNAEARAQEISDLKTRNDLVKEGYDVDTQAFDDELAKRQAINAEIAKTDVAIQRINNEDRDYQQLAADFTRVVGTNFEDALNKGQSLRTVFKGLEQDIAQMIERLTVTKPLENALTELLTGKPTENGGSANPLGMLFSKLFGGSSSSDGADDSIVDDDTGGQSEGESELFGGDDDISFNADGGVFDRGAQLWGGRRVRYFASGGVVDTPTAFQMASGVGVMGEAGPEAVMPLTQMSNGKLGVHAGGAGGGVTHIYDMRGADPSVEPKLKALMSRINAVDGSIEKRALTTVVRARNSNPLLLQPY